jgi:hypothetical protein
LPKAALESFFNAAMMGDGCASYYYTTSEKLKDDFSEVALKIGRIVYNSHRYRPDREGPTYEISTKVTKSGGTELLTGNHLYNVDTSTKRNSNIYKVPFSGYVYCVGIPETHTFIARQDGSVWISGNTWVKKMFVDPVSANTPFWATDENKEIIRFPTGHSREGEPLFKRRFIPATLFDNPYLANDGMYEANLLSLPEMQRRQLLEGDWTINEGAAFTEFNTSIHTVKPFEIPTSWPRFRACDYGYGSYSGVLWFAVAPDEQIIVYREMYVSKVLAADLAEMILEAESSEKIKYGVLDSSLWHKRGDTGPSLAETMIRKGCRWRPSDRSAGSRVAGKNEIHRRLQVDEFTEKPRMIIFDTCRSLIEQLPSLPLDKNNPEDVDTKAEDHLYDALRYGLMSRPKTGLFDYDNWAGKKQYQPADNTFGY